MNYIFVQKNGVLTNIHYLWFKQIQILEIKACQLREWAKCTNLIVCHDLYDIPIFMFFKLSVQPQAIQFLLGSIENRLFYLEQQSDLGHIEIIESKSYHGLVVSKSCRWRGNWYTGRRYSRWSKIRSYPQKTRKSIHLRQHQHQEPSNAPRTWQHSSGRIFIYPFWGRTKRTVFFIHLWRHSWHNIRLWNVWILNKDCLRASICFKNTWN